MKNKINNTIRFTGGKSNNHIREDNDYYATPKKDTRKFLKEYFNISNYKNILEPACGEGHMSEVLKEFNVNITSYDLINRNYQDKIVDFLKDEITDDFDLIITNPPFKYAMDFIKKGLDISDNVVILAKIQLLEGINRSNEFKKLPLKYIYGSSSRINCFKGGLELNPNTNKPWNSAMFLAWYVFDKNYKGEPIYRWII